MLSKSMLPKIVCHKPSLGVLNYEAENDALTRPGKELIHTKS